MVAAVHLLMSNFLCNPKRPRPGTGCTHPITHMDPGSYLHALTHTPSQNSPTQGTPNEDASPHRDPKLDSSPH